MPHPVIAFFAPGGGELIVVMLALLLLFGPKDAPRMLRNFQNVLNKLKRTATDFQRALMTSELPVDPPDKSNDGAVYDEAKQAPATPPAPSATPPPADKPAP
jgi:Sec-independent protein translocase protein TatA